MNKNDKLKSEKSAFDQIIFILDSNLKIFALIFFLIALILPLSAGSRDSLISLIEQSVTKWVEALRTFTNDIFSDCNQLVELGIERTITFTQDLANFYLEIFISFNFNIINQTGYILIGIYIMIPILIIIMFIMIIKEKMISNIYKRLTTPTSLVIVLLIIPFPSDFIWIGAIVGIVLFSYWYAARVKEEQEANRELTLIEIIQWKKTVLFVGLMILFMLSIVETFQSSEVTLVSLSGLNPSFLLLGLFLLLLILAVIWFVVYSSITKRRIIEIVKWELKKYLTLKQIILYLIIISIAIPVFDSLIFQTSISTIVIVIINIPWIIALIIHDPFLFFGILITAIKDGFDTVVDAAREISGGLVPVTPSKISILGALQPTISLTLILIGIFILAYAFLKAGKEKKKYPDKEIRNIASNYVNTGLVVAILIILAIIAFIFKPSTFNAIFGDLYEIDTDPIALYIILGIIGLILGVFLATLFWGVIQIQKGRSWRIVSTSIFINGLAAGIAIVMVVPFIWMLKNSLQTNSQNSVDFQKQGLLPDPFTTRNYAQIFGLVQPQYETLEYRVVTWLFNSLIAAGLVTAFLVIFSAMAGYCLAKRDFIGRKLIFTLTIAILMVPPYVQVIPLYLELNRLGFVGSLLGVIFPFLIQPFSIFLCAEFMKGIPDDYLDAARIDGYSEFQIFRKIVLPLSIPVLSVMIIINIIGNWNAFMWPLLLLDQTASAPQLRTLPLGIYHINSELQEQMGVILALATVIVLPIFIILFLAQDYIKRGVTVEGLKG